MKKIILIFLVLSLLLISACGDMNASNSAQEKIMQVYNSYVAYAEDGGILPLSYEDWLEQIKGKDGITPRFRIDEETFYWEISYDGGKNWITLDIKARGEDGQSLQPLSGKVIVNFGDSIFGNATAPNDVSSKLASVTGATVHNVAFGGCRMSVHSSSYYAPFSMYRLADAVVTGDFSAQEEALERASTAGQTGALVTKFPQRLELLKSLDFNEVDIVTIAYGTNDFTANVAVDDYDVEYSTSVSSFAGALRYSIERLLTAYPHLRIYVCSQTYRFWMDEDGNFTEDSDTYETGQGLLLRDFVNATYRVAYEYHLPYIDLYDTLGINKYNKTHYFPATDGVHHNQNGRDAIAEQIARALA